MRKMRHREGVRRGPGNTAGEWQSWGLKPRLLDSRPAREGFGEEEAFELEDGPKLVWERAEDTALWMMRRARVKAQRPGWGMGVGWS